MLQLGDFACQQKRYTSHKELHMKDLLINLQCPEANSQDYSTTHGKRQLSLRSTPNPVHHHRWEHNLQVPGISD